MRDEQKILHKLRIACRPPIKTNHTRDTLIALAFLTAILGLCWWVSKWL